MNTESKSGATTGVVEELLSVKYLDDLDREGLERAIKQTRDQLEDDINDAMHAISVATARLAALHFQQGAAA